MMSFPPKKTTDNLNIADLIDAPVWEYTSHEDRFVRPVSELPVDSLDNRLVGTKVRLSSGEELWAVLSNISLRNPRRTRQFLTVWLEKNGVWFELARYHDIDYPRRGPNQLAEFLEFETEQVFPILYDISEVAVGDGEVLKGRIPLEPEERLTLDELIDLSVSLE